MWIMLFIILSTQSPSVERIAVHKPYGTYEKCMADRSKIKDETLSMSNPMPPGMDLYCVPLNEDQWKGLEESHKHNRRG